MQIDAVDMNSYITTCTKGYSDLVSSDCLYYNETSRVKIEVKSEPSDCIKTADEMNKLFESFLYEPKKEPTLNPNISAIFETESDDKQASLLVSIKITWLIFLKLSLNLKRYFPCDHFS